MSAYPRDGDGTECPPRGDPDCGVPVNTAIELRLDRYLLPATAVRQSIRVYAGGAENSVSLEPYYDLIERVLVYRPAGGRLQPGLLYNVELIQPEEERDSFGLRAFDGAPLAEGPIPLRFSFRTGRLVSDSPAPDPPPTCADVLEVFEQAGCARGGCHGAPPEAAMGLRLDSAAGLRDTAIRRVARQTEVGPVAGRPLVNPPRFGAQMPIIDPRSPANSYLLYKLLQNEESFLLEGSSCDTAYSAELPRGACPPPSPEESLRLREWFVRGDPMPPDGALPSRRALRVIEAFIREGARLDGCD